MLKNLSDDSVRLTCDLHDGRCCYGESLELFYDDFFDGCEGSPYATLNVVVHPKNLWECLLYYFKHKEILVLSFALNFGSAVALRNRVEQVVKQMNKVKS